MASSGAAVHDSDDSSDSQPSVFARKDAVSESPGSSSSSPSESSSSSPAESVVEYTRRYRKLPKKRKRSIGLRLMTYATGRPRHANWIKKKSREEDGRGLFHMSTVSLLTSLLGYGLKDTKMYYITMDDSSDEGDDEAESSSENGDCESSHDKGDKGKKKADGSKPKGKIYAAGGAGGGGGGPPGAGAIPIKVPPPMTGIPKFSVLPYGIVPPPGSGPRFPPGMIGVPPAL
ncbi:hypothetical protein LIA77_09659 [Sarocladium implicatum]|nr:hypothetical protein LIA77_09659 [Sarocladium implicatum]